MPDGPIEKKVYQNQNVKDAIDKLNDNKCGYCGVTLSQDIQRDVEHYRPGKAVIYNSLLKFDTGYYWLTADWDNLLPSCRPCNSLEGREYFCFKDGSRKKKKNFGKGNHFPLETPPLKAPNHIVGILNEVPLIMNPYTIDPNTIFDYVECLNGQLPIVFVCPKENLSPLNLKIALTSIDILGLNRMLLCTDRAKVWNFISVNLSSLSMVLDTSDFKIIADHLKRLLLYIDPTLPSSSFIGMIWTIFYYHLKDLASEINRIDQNILPINDMEEILLIFRNFRDKYFQHRPLVRNEVYISKKNILNL